MVLYSIKGYPEYKITEDGVLCNNNGLLVDPAYSGGYIVHNNTGSRRLLVKRLMELADLPYNRSMEPEIDYKHSTKEMVKKRRDIEDRLLEEKDKFAW